MSIVIGSRKRGRSRTRGSGGGRSSRSRSSMSSIMSRSTKAGDGTMRRGWSNPQQITSFFYDPFPARMRAVLRYSETFTLNPAAGSTGHSLWRCGSIFDPNYTGIGHQPYGRDTYASIYNHYTVLKSNIKVTCITNTTSASPGAIFGVTMTDDPVVSGTYDTVREVKPTKFAALNQSSDPHNITMQYDAKRVFGPSYASTQNALMDANPADDHFFDVWLQSDLSGGDVPQHAFIACIEYYCEFSELRDLAQS